MTILSKPIDYTDRDFAALRARLFSLIRSAFPQWSGEDVKTFGNILVESFAFVGDVLGKYQDAQARESRWTQATQRKNLLALSKLVGYVPSGATASLVDATISTRDGSAATSRVGIPAGTIVRTSAAADPVEFQTLADAEIVVGQSEVAGVTAENSEVQGETQQSSGQPSQEIELSATPYLDDSAVVTASQGTFTEVDDFLDSSATDLHFTVSVDQNDRATLRFGDGVNGEVPTGPIEVTYKTGGGTSGQVDPGEVNVIEGTFLDDLGAEVQLAVTNPEASTPSTDRETRAEIRQNAPRSIRVQTNTVAREDFEIVAEEVPGIARALFVTADEDDTVQENFGHLYLVADGGGAPTAAQFSAVEAKYTTEKPKQTTFRVLQFTALFETIDVRARVWLTAAASETAAAKTAVKAAIVSALTSHFSPKLSDGTDNDEVDFGFAFVEMTGDQVGKYPLSRVQNVVNDVDGVQKIGDDLLDMALNGAHEDVTLELRAFPVLGTVTIIDGATNEEL